MAVAESEKPPAFSFIGILTGNVAGFWPPGFET
jgi:hypothetical protein